MMVFEFISLECLRQNELGGDEIYIRYGSRQVYPDSGRHVPFRKGGVLINDKAIVEQGALMELLGRKGTRRVEDLPGTEKFRRCEVPSQGLTVEVMEHDTLSRDDVVARHLVGGAVTGGPTTEDFNTINGHYRLTYQVVATR